MAAAAVAAAAAACSGCTNRACIWPRSIKKEEDEQDENEGSRCGGQRRASCSVRRTSSTRRTIYRATGDAARGRRVLTGRRWRRRGCSCVCSGTPRVSATPPLLRVRASPTHLPPPSGSGGRLRCPLGRPGRCLGLCMFWWASRVVLAVRSAARVACREWSNSRCIIRSAGELVHAAARLEQLCSRPRRR